MYIKIKNKHDLCIYINYYKFIFSMYIVYLVYDNSNENDNNCKIRFHSSQNDCDILEKWYDTIGAQINFINTKLIVNKYETIQIFKTLYKDGNITSENKHFYKNPQLLQLFITKLRTIVNLFENTDVDIDIINYLYKQWTNTSINFDKSKNKSAKTNFFDTHMQKIDSPFFKFFDTHKFDSSGSLSFNPLTIKGTIVDDCLVNKNNQEIDACNEYDYDTVHDSLTYNIRPDKIETTDLICIYNILYNFSFIIEKDAINTNITDIIDEYCDEFKIKTWSVPNTLDDDTKTIIYKHIDSVIYDSSEEINTIFASVDKLISTIMNNQDKIPIKKYINDQYVLDNNISNLEKASTIIDQVLKNIGINETNIKSRNLVSKCLIELGLKKKRCYDGYYYYGIKTKYKLMEDVVRHIVPIDNTPVDYDKLDEERTQQLKDLFPNESFNALSNTDKYNEFIKLKKSLHINSENKYTGKKYTEFINKKHTFIENNITFLDEGYHFGKDTTGRFSS
jgi:hypothetical protein